MHGTQPSLEQRQLEHHLVAQLDLLARLELAVAQMEEDIAHAVDGLLHVDPSARAPLPVHAAQLDVFGQVICGERAVIRGQFAHALLVLALFLFAEARARAAHGELERLGRVVAEERAGVRGARRVASGQLGRLGDDREAGRRGGRARVELADERRGVAQRSGGLRWV